MPASSARQKRFLAAELGRKEKGQPTKTDMSTRQLKDFVKAPVRKPKRSK